MFKQVVAAGAAVVVLAACTESPAAPTANGGELTPSLSNSVARTGVCHVDAQGEVKVLLVPDPAFGIHEAHGDYALQRVFPAGSTVTASNFHMPETDTWRPENAFDGLLGQGHTWNAGDFPNPTQWIEVDFRSPQSFQTITAVVNNLPNGETNHDVSLDGVTAFSWSGFTSERDLLSLSFVRLQTAQTVRITTTLSPSWVAWHEIEVLGC